MNAYQIVTVDLATPRARVEVVGRGLGVTSVTVLAMTVGAVFELHIGQRQGIPVPGAGFILDQFCPPEMTGVLISNDAQVGRTVTLYVSYGSAVASLEG